jgi:hypothetical protein
MNWFVRLLCAVGALAAVAIAVPGEANAGCYGRGCNDWRGPTVVVRPVPRYYAPPRYYAAPRYYYRPPVVYAPPRYYRPYRPAVGVGVNLNFPIIIR